MQPFELAPGTVLSGKYRIERVLGEGGMGVVLAAHHLLLDERVALKLLLPDALKDEATVARFDREARAAVKIKSEHVARVIDVGKLEGGAPYMVMEYLEGEDIEHAILRRGPLPVEESVGYILEACEAIAEAHALGIVHRDLKPGNLFVTNRPSGPPIVKVLDFGISKLTLSDKEKQLTSATAMMGSPAYMSPEHLTAAHIAGVPSDIWSLGVVLYEMLTATVPFDGKSMPELVAAILTGVPRPLQAIRPDVPPGLDAVVARCVAKNPNDRFASVAELARALLPFAPPRAIQSLEKIEHVLSGGASRQPSLPSISGAWVPQSSSPSHPQIHNRTFNPTTSSSVASPRRPFVVPLIILTACLLMGGGAAALIYALRGTHAEPAVADTSSATANAGVAIQPAVAAETTSEPVSLPVPPPPPPIDSRAQLAASAPPAASLSAPAASVSAPPGGTRMHGQPPPTTTKTSPCHLVTTFDAKGNKHFHQECK